MYEDTVKRPWPETKEKRAKKTAGVLGTKSVKSDLDTKGRGVRELKGHTQTTGMSPLPRDPTLTVTPGTVEHSLRGEASQTSQLTPQQSSGRGRGAICPDLLLLS